MKRYIYEDQRSVSDGDVKGNKYSMALNHRTKTAFDDCSHAFNNWNVYEVITVDGCLLCASMKHIKSGLVQIEVH